jgi:hypothetical protein
MNKTAFHFLLCVLFLISSCTTQKPIPRSVAYESFYKEKPSVVLIMPPINKTTNVECKEYFQPTLLTPLANAGYYVVPPFLSMDILKKESAYDSELYFNQSLTKFGEVFGADMALFTIINKWDKNVLSSTLAVEVEYIFKSVKTEVVLYDRIGTVIFDTSVKMQNNGVVFSSIFIAAANTVAPNYLPLARTCNEKILSDLPAGRYSVDFGEDGEKIAGAKHFTLKVTQ